jgi:hypothetical protein
LPRITGHESCCMGYLYRNLGIGLSVRDTAFTWSIAKLTSSNQRGNPLANKRKQEVRQQAASPLPAQGSAIGTDRMSPLATAASDTGGRVEFQPSRQLLDQPASSGRVMEL